MDEKNFMGFDFCLSLLVLSFCPSLFCNLSFSLSFSSSSAASSRVERKRGSIWILLLYNRVMFFLRSTRHYFLEEGSAALEWMEHGRKAPSRNWILIDHLLLLPLSRSCHWYKMKKLTSFFFPFALWIRKLSELFLLSLFLPPLSCLSFFLPSHGGKKMVQKKRRFSDSFIHEREREKERRKSPDSLTGFWVFDAHHRFLLPFFLPLLPSSSLWKMFHLIQATCPKRKREEEDEKSHCLMLSSALSASTCAADDPSSEEVHLYPSLKMFSWNRRRRRRRRRKEKGRMIFCCCLLPFVVVRESLSSSSTQPTSSPPSSSSILEGKRKGVFSNTPASGAAPELHVIDDLVDNQQQEIYDPPPASFLPFLLPWSLCTRRREKAILDKTLC